MSELKKELDFCVFWLAVRKGCMKYGGSVSGGPRTEKRNTTVGGVPNSWHLWSRGGLASDIVFDEPEGQARAVTYFREEGFDVIVYDSHIHVEPAG